MAISSFDTHNYFRQLTTSGIAFRHAEAHTKALTTFMSNELVRRSDLKEFKSEIRFEFGEFKSEIRFEFSEFKAEMKSDFDEFKSAIDKKFDAIDKKFYAVDTRFAGIQGQLDLLKWMMGFTLAGVFTILFKLFL
ncbi:MAG: hypothetical protein JWQ10_1290 [Herbaspirillum sp.]|nr:hypothetical protein [Herbaspirillum sp.]